MDLLLLNLGFIFLMTGLISGFIAGLLGVGGGIIIVPTIYFILLYLGYPSSHVMHVSVATSLGVIVFTSISSIRSHMKLNNVDFKVIKLWIPGIIIGSILGSFFTSNINGDILVVIFVSLLFLVSLQMLFQRNTIIFSKDIPSNKFINFLISYTIGFLSATIGIGGGSFSVPTLSSFSKSIHKSVGTSAVLGFFIALPGSLTYAFLNNNISDLPPYSLGYLNLFIILLVASTSVFTANIGAKISYKTKTTTLKKIFAVFLFCTCISLIIEHFIF